MTNRSTLTNLLLLAGAVAFSPASVTTSAQEVESLSPESHVAPSRLPTPVDECQVIARVDGQVVLSCEVLWEANLMLEKNRGKFPPDKEEEIRQQIMAQHLMSMLDMKMLYADFRRKAPQADLAAIASGLQETWEKNEIPRLMKQVGAQEPGELESRLLEVGTTLRQRREAFNQRMISRSWVSESVRINREVTHQEMLDYYQEHLADYEYPTQARWEEIMVRFDRFSDKPEAYRAIAQIGNAAYRQVASQGAPIRPAFAEIAKTKSHGHSAQQGGQHDWTTEGALTAESINEALFKLSQGEMSPILESDRGFHIVRVLERKLAGRQPFTDVQTEIRKEIRDERFDKALSEKLTKMRREAKIWTLYTGDIDSAQRAAAMAGPTRR